MKHFNLEVKNRNKLTKENYIENIVFEDKQELKEILQVYDEKIEKLLNLSKLEFENQINLFIKKFKGFKEVYDLNDCNFIGFYLMILDDYKQVYLGVSNNIKKRIVQHWNRKVKKEYLSSKVNGYGIGIDSFKPYDTTRIFVKKYSTDGIKVVNDILQQMGKEKLKEKDFYAFMEEEESKMIKFFNSEFVCNRYIRVNTFKIKKSSIKKD